MRQCDLFVKWYVDTALWASSDLVVFVNNGDGVPPDGDGPSRSAEREDISAETLREMEADARNFYAEYGDLFGENVTRAAADFWLTRNRHGAGFWDGDWDEDAGRLLTEAAHTEGTFVLYLGDDNKVHHHN